MNFTLSIFDSFHGLEIDSLIEFKEILLHPVNFSKQGRLADRGLRNLIRQISKAGVSPIVNFDGLYTDQKIRETLPLIKSLRKKNVGFRFMDLGLALAVKEACPLAEIQLNLERDTHNLEKILRLERWLGNALKKVTLSNEIPFAKILEYGKKVQCETEILGAGRLEIFHTPRPLIKNAFGIEGKELYANLTSMERVSSLNHAYIENENSGTLFYERDLFILHEVLGISQQNAGKTLPDLRLDLYREEHFKTLQKGGTKEEWISNLQRVWGNKTTLGFFRVNKTQAQFKRLKNQHIKGEAERIGEVLEYGKHRQLLIRIDESFLPGTPVLIVNPHGEKLDYDFRPKNEGNFPQTNGPVQPGLYFGAWIPKAYPNSILIKKPVFSPQTDPTAFEAKTSQ